MQRFPRKHDGRRPQGEWKKIDRARAQREKAEQKRERATDHGKIREQRRQELRRATDPTHKQILRTNFGFEDRYIWAHGEKDKETARDLILIYNKMLDEINCGAFKIDLDKLDRRK